MVSGSVGAGALLASVYYFRKKRESITPKDLPHIQSTLEPGPEKIRSSKLYKSQNGEVFHYSDERIRTLYDTFREGAKLSRTGNCLGWRGGPNKTYIWQTYNETLQRATNFGSGLITLGLSPSQDSNLGIYLQNCPEWITAEIAAFTYSMVVVALYDTLGVEACTFIMNQTKMTVIICGDDKKVNNLLDQSPQYLKIIVTLVEVSPSTFKRANICGVEIYTFAAVEDIGAKNKQQCLPPKPDDVFTICYTSGTTGVPKGAMLSHSNAVATINSLFVHMSDCWVNKDDVLLSFLPLAHVYERTVEHMIYSKGGAVGFFSGDVLHLNDDIQALRPTVMATVPRLLNKMHDKVISSLLVSKTKKFLFKLALSGKESEEKRGIIRNDSIWDKLVFWKVQKSMGGRLRLMITGSAPVSSDVLSFVRCVLGCQVVEGYGQSETMVTSLTFYGEVIPGHVGPPLPCCKIKLVDTPESGYYSANNQGEVCVKGANVFKGYYQDPEKTWEVIDDDGWLHTGDIGEWLPNGALKIIDRKKHIFKLSQGEYVAPEKIEKAYLGSLFVEQVVIHGESLKSCIVAIVVPTKDVITNWASDRGILGSMSQLCENKQVKDAILKDMLQCGQAAGLKSFEQVKDIWLHPEPFTSTTGLLTPTMKTKRPEVKAYFKTQIENMYKNLN